MLVTVTKYRLVFKRDLLGAIVRDAAGRPVVERRVGAPWDNRPLLLGLFSRLDASLGFTFNRGGVSAEKTETTEATGDLGTVEFRSTLDLKGNAELAGAWFVVSSVVLGKDKFGNWASATVIDSALWELHLPRHETGMTAIVEGDALKGPKVSNWGSFATRSWYKNWVPESISVTIARIGLGAGVLMTYGADPPTTRDGQIVREVSTALVGTGAALFGYNSADLDVPDPFSDSTGRARCEMALAELRGLLTAGGTQTKIIGLTSPEGTTAHNAVLSQNRARAVRQAMFDAFGPLLTSIPSMDGYGEFPSRTAGLYPADDVMLLGGGLPDPEDTKYPNRAAFLASKDGATRAKWPAWRRVDIIADGTLAIRYTVKNDPTVDG